MDSRMDMLTGGLNEDDNKYYLDDYLLKELWIDLDKQFSIDEIREVAIETASEYRDAVVTAFLPIFIFRRTREKLQEILEWD